MFVFQRASIGKLNLFNDLNNPIRSEKGSALALFHLSHFLGDQSPLIQEAQQLLVDFVDLFAQIWKIGTHEYQNRIVRKATEPSMRKMFQAALCSSGRLMILPVLHQGFLRLQAKYSVTRLAHRPMPHRFQQFFANRSAVTPHQGQST